MKNIAIFGSSRSGKSTLAKMISEKYPNYHIIEGDCIRWSFQKTLPNTNINSKNGRGMKEDFPNFLATLFYTVIENNDTNINYIIETCDITPNKAKELFSKDNTIILFLGTPNHSISEHIKIIRANQTEKSWCYQKSNEYLINHSKKWLDRSKQYQEECNKLGIWYVDTSFNVNKVLKDTLRKIEKMMN